jgi:toxin-antitoxin system PIN domain toxin
MILDANLLLYAYNADAPQQAAAAKWLDGLLTSGEIIGLPWVTAWAFVRICTNTRIWSNPLAAKQAFAILDQWWDQPDVIALQPGPRHREILERLVTEHNATGPLLTDAVLAALAIENGATLASTDQDFSRFQSLRWTNPLGGLPGNRQK